MLANKPKTKILVDGGDPEETLRVLPEGSSDEATRKNLREFYKTTMAIPADSIARAIAYAIEQPAEVAINEIVIRPTAKDF